MITLIIRRAIKRDSILWRNLAVVRAVRPVIDPASTVADDRIRRPGSRGFGVFLDSPKSGEIGEPRFGRGHFLLQPLSTELLSIRAVTTSLLLSDHRSLCDLPRWMLA